MQKWNTDLVLIEARKLIKQYGRLPGANTLRKAGRTDFLMAVRGHYPGSMSQLRLDLNAPTGQKPMGFWTKERIIEETKKIIDSEGKMPLEKRLSELGLNTINKYAQKYFGGLHGLAQACGISEKELYTKSGFWKDFNNVENELKLVIAKIGRFPTTTDFKVNGYQYLLNPISTYYGGLKKVRQRMGYVDREPIAKDGHYCDSWQEVIIDDFLYKNKIPHQRGVRIKFSGIRCDPDFIVNDIVIEVLMADYRIEGHKGRYLYYINRYHKKRLAYEKHNIQVLEVFPDEFMNPENLKRKLKTILKICRIPQPHVLEGFTSIVFFDKKSPGYWRNKENFKTELMPLVKKYGRIPTVPILRKIGRNDIEGAILSKPYGSYRAVAKAIGLDENDYPKSQGYWRNPNNIKKELSSVIEKYGFIPSKSELKRFGKTGIVTAIESYGMSLKEIAISLGVEHKPSKMNNGYWLNDNQIKKELEHIIKELGHFPSAPELRLKKKHGLLKGILANYKNFRTAAIKLGFVPSENKPKGYWKDINNVFSEVLKFVDKYGKIPSCKVLEKQKPILMYAIRRYHGGMEKFKSEYNSKCS